MFRGYLYKEYPKRFKTIVRRLNSLLSIYIQEMEESLYFFLLEMELVFPQEKTENTNEYKEKRG